MTARSYFLGLLLLSVINALSPSSLAAQDLVVKNYKKQDGLNSNNIRQTFQAKNGLLWILSDKGLSNYDGESFNNFQDLPNLKLSRVIGMFEDSDGVPWFQLGALGLCAYKEGIFHAYEHNDTLVKLLEGRAFTDAYFDEEDCLHVFPHFSDTLITIDSKGKFSIQTIGKEKAQLFLYKTADDDILAPVLHNNFGNKSIQSKDLKKLQCIKSGDSTWLKWSSDFWINPHAPVHFGKKLIYLALGRHLMTIDERGVSQLYQYPDVIYGILEDRSGALWLSTVSDLFYHKDGQARPEAEGMLKGKNIGYLLEDHEGGLWLASKTDGLFYIASSAWHYLNPEEKWSDKNIVSLSIRDRLLAAANSQGEVMLFQGIEKSKKLAKWEFSIHPKSSITLMENYLSVGNAAVELKPDHEPFAFFERFVATTLKQTKEDCMFFSDYTAVWSLCFNKKEEVFHHSSQPKVLAMLLDRKDQLWLATKEGLLCNDSLVKGSIGEVRIHQLLEDTLRQGLWALTTGDGCFFIGKDKLYQLNKESGLSSNFLSKACIGRNGDLWLASDNGVNQIRIEDNLFGEALIINYTTADGLPSNQLNDLLLYRDTLLIASNKGMVYAALKDLESNPIAPVVLLKGIKTDQRQFRSSTRIDLMAEERNLSFDFIGLSFRSERNISYEYLLKGQDKEWVQTEEGKANYTNLAPGQYQFYVRARNKDGVWSEETLLSTLIIKPYLSENGWFQFLLGVLFLASLSFLFYLLLRNIKLKEEKKRRLIKAENVALRVQLNPHFIFNALNSIQYFISREQKQDAYTYIADFSALMRSVLEYSSMETIPLRWEIDYLQAYLNLEKLRFEEGFDYEIKLDQSIDMDEERIPPMLLQPILENAIEHGILPKGGKGKVLLHIYTDKEGTVYQIEDDGVGRSNLKEKRRKGKRSFALVNIKERLQLIYENRKLATLFSIEDLKDDKGGARGTIVRIKLPK
jgi:ligand-binding sensor domain-containing protein